MSNTAHVLIVDDSQEMLASLKRTLRSNRLTIHAAQNTEEAKQLMLDHDMSVVLADYKMPGANGAELLAWTKQHCPTASRLMVSGVQEYQTVLDAINEAQVLQFIPKPWDPQALRTTIDQAIEISSGKIREHTIQQLFEGVHEGVLQVDCYGLIQYTNSAFDKLLGYQNGTLVGQPASTLRPMAEEDQYRYMRQQVMRHGEWHGIIQMLNTNRAEITFDASVKAHYNECGGLESFVFYLAHPEESPAGWELIF